MPKKGEVYQDLPNLVIQSIDNTNHSLSILSVINIIDCW
jgi:hypothetical protein